MTANIAQIELFHIGMHRTLEQLSQDIRARVLDDFEAGDFDRPNLLKTCFRIYDWNNVMTRYVRDLDAMPDAIDDYSAIESAKSWLARRLAYRAQRRNAKRRGNLKRMMTVDGGRLVRDAIRAEDDVAIEVANHRYRLMRPDEAAEMLSRATHYTSAWLFVFAPNELLADKNERVGSIALVL